MSQQNPYNAMPALIGQMVLHRLRLEFMAAAIRESLASNQGLYQQPVQHQGLNHQPRHSNWQNDVLVGVLADKVHHLYRDSPGDIFLYDMVRVVCGSYSRVIQEQVEIKAMQLLNIDVEQSLAEKFAGEKQAAEKLPA